MSHMLIYHQCNQSIHVTEDGVAMPLSTSLLQKINVAMDRLYQIV
jgi:hypothetical protein